MKRNITLAVLLLSLLAVGAYAQSETEPVKEQSRQDGSENAANPGNGTANQNYQEYENAKPGEAHDPSGPAGSTAQGEANQGSKEPVVTNKDGEPAPDRNYGDSDGNNYELGGNHRNGDDFTGEGGPHGSVVTLDGDKDGEGDGDQTRQRLFGDGDGDNHELGENNRRGGEFTGEGGPHGPMGVGPDSDLLKIFGDDSDGTFAGDLMRHVWGPGSSELDGPFGPNSDRAGFGPGGRDAVDGKADPATSVRGHARSGRR